MDPFWTNVNETTLRQGDFLPDCCVPEFPSDFAERTDAARIIQADQADLIVITQSCDLEHGKVSLVALCPIWAIPFHGLSCELACRRPCQNSDSERLL